MELKDDEERVARKYLAMGFQRGLREACLSLIRAKLGGLPPDARERLAELTDAERLEWLVVGLGTAQGAPAVHEILRVAARFAKTLPGLDGMNVRDDYSDFARKYIEIGRGQMLAELRAELHHPRDGELRTVLRAFCLSIHRTKIGPVPADVAARLGAITDIRALGALYRDLEAAVDAEAALAVFAARLP